MQSSIALPSNRPRLLVLLIASLLIASIPALSAETVSREQTLSAMRRAATFFRTKAASHGGYVYGYLPDLSRRWGEGEATAQQVWVQAPGTPAVGLAFLKAFEATGDRFYLDAAREAAEALVFGQLKSGGWTNVIDFDPQGARVAQYRNGKGRGRDHSTLDDGISQNALRLLMHVDRALEFRHAAIHEAVEFGRNALLQAQFSSGGFPQVWAAPVTSHAPMQAQFPDYDWRTQNRIKEYWNLPTLNDNLAGDITRVLADAWEIYPDERSRQALERFGNFLLLAQMPEPQPAWAQQYDTQMRPVWARKFEPPAITGSESQDVLETLLRLHRLTGEAKYLEPIPRALAYLQRCLLPDGRLARFYELKTNTPLYMTRDYVLTYDDSDVPQHYGWKVKSRLKSIEAAWQSAKKGEAETARGKPGPPQIRSIIDALDDQGRWLSVYTDQKMSGAPKFKPGDRFLESAVFSKNLESLSEFVRDHSVQRLR